MFGVAEMREVREAVGRYAGGFDAALVTAADAQRIVADATAAANMLATVVAMAGDRVARTDLWRTQGDRSAAHHLARLSGTSVGRAREALDTAGHLGGLPAVEAAARRGELSPAQVAPVADAASKAPGAEKRLLAAAKNGSLGELLDTCARTKAAALPDDGSRHRAIHAARCLRRRQTADGGGELLYRSTLEEVAEIFAIVQGWADRRFRTARSEGRRESTEAYLADGLLDAVRASLVHTGGKASTPTGAGAATATDGTTANSEPGAHIPAGPLDTEPGLHELRLFGAEPLPDDGGLLDTEPFPDSPPLFATGPLPDRAEPDGRTPAAGEGAGVALPPPPKPPSPTKVLVRIDLDALLRGWPIDGEVSEIAGLGPIPVSAVRQMIATGNPFLAAVVTKGVDVVNVAHLGRKATAFQQSGLEWLNPECPVLGCNRSSHLEIDHRVDWADSKITLLHLLDRPCDHHDDKKTYEGWALVEGTGKRPMVPPDDPRHPRHKNGAGPPGETDAA